MRKGFIKKYNVEGEDCNDKCSRAIPDDQETLLQSLLEELAVQKSDATLNFARMTSVSSA